MVGEHELAKVGNKKYLVVNCQDCANNSSLGNITCFRRIMGKMREVEGVDNIMFQRGYRKILNEKSFAILSEYLKALNELPKGEDLCDSCFEADSIMRFKTEEDPVGAVIHLLDFKPCEEHKKYFESIKKILGKTELWKIVESKRKDYKEAELYHLIFRDRIVPAFVTFFVEPIADDAEILEEYEIGGASVKIYKPKDKPYPIYHITPKELNLSKDELKLLNDAFTSLQNEEYDITRGMAICEKAIEKLAPELSEEKKKELARALNRYSFGYGIVEVLFMDPKLQDIYVDSPGNKPIYVYHADYEECTTNIILAPEELEKLSTRFRLMSGRPFDESYPVLHAELKDMGIRIAGITEPMTFNGTGFAFRKHSVEPWTLQRFMKNKMISAEAAGLMSFLIDGQQSILVTGPRGSGKTSFLGSLLAEVPQNFRIVTIEDTPELPIEAMRDLGFNIQHIKVKSTLQRESYEVSAEEALRSALRLGESVLVLGEVRGEEAKSLFEAMRIGAAGNVVMGTIHGSSAYDVWDRIVNDLNVPSTSFKAANVIISCAPIRIGEDIRRHRRVLGVTEVLKHWNKDPQEEKGFLNLMEYDRRKDILVISKDFRKSEILKEIARKKGMSMADAVRSIKVRGQIKDAVVKASKKNRRLLDVDFAMMSTNKFLELVREYKNKVNYNKVFSKFKSWLKVQEKSFALLNSLEAK
jgi:type IV secretory pathway ATPase VirB11/archaellum biosynthesis ATPase